LTTRTVLWRSPLQRARHVPQVLRERWHRWRFRRSARQVMRLNPLPVGDLGYTLLSMVQKKDLHPYLLAALSLARQAPPRRVVVICDPSIDTQDRAAIRQLIPHVELEEAKDYRHPRLPTGGCWERLQAICHHAARGYVVQLDADTVTRGPVPEVREAIAGQRAFCLAERANQTRCTFEQAREVAAGWAAEPEPHVQAVAEVSLLDARLPGRWYVRGCAGFAGFPQRQDYLAQVLEFSAEMQRLCGERWQSWGSEQVTCNYVLANQEAFSLLPWPRFAMPEPGRPLPDFAHFMGSVRFTSDRYRQTLLRSLESLHN
jgi:hypothetical protein